MSRSRLVLVAALLVACGGEPSSPAPAPTPVPGPRAQPVEPPPPPPLAGAEPPADPPAGIALLTNPVALVVPAFHQGLTLLEQGLRDGRREDLVAAEALLLEALRVTAEREGVSLAWVLGEAESHGAAAGRHLPYRLVGALMYLAFTRAQLGDPALRDRILDDSLVDADAYAFHFDTRAVDEVIRFEQLDACFSMATHVQGVLERWRSDHGGLYPETLAELVPELLPAVPSCPQDGTSYEELYERLDEGRDFRLRCHAHQPINGGPLCVGPRCGAAVDSGLEQTFKIYPMLLGSFLGLDRRDLFLPLLLERAPLASGQVVADIGAGAGLFTLPFAQAVGREGKVYAVDINASVLAFVQARAQSHDGAPVETVLSTRPDVALPPGELDAAFIIQTYHAMLDLDRPDSPEVWRDKTGPWMRTVHAALAPGATLVIQDGADKMDPDRVAANLATLGFEVVSIERGWDRQYIAVFRKTQR
jgi:SAM-dependent methyltransferase